MSGMSDLIIENNEADERGNFDPQDVAYWEAYCNMKEVLPAKVFNRLYGETFESFYKAIDELVKDDG